MLGELVGLKPNEGGNIITRPANIVAELEKLSDIAESTQPKETKLSYWLIALSAVRRNGLSDEQVDDYLHLKKIDARVIRRACKDSGYNPTQGRAICIGVRCKQAADALKIISNGYGLDPSYNFLRSAVTTRQGLFLFANSALVGIEGCFDPEIASPLRSTVNQICENLFIVDSPNANMLTNLRDSLLEGVLAKMGLPARFG